MIQNNGPVPIAYQGKSFVKDSYNIYPLTYSTSSYNNNTNSIHSNSPIKSSLHLPLYNNTNDIHGSVYSFSKPQSTYNFNIQNHRVSNSNRYMYSNANVPLSPRINNSNLIAQRKVQTQLPPSYSMLNNQQNYVFNNRSSLKSLSNQYQNDHLIPVSQLSGSSRQYQRTFTFQPSQGSDIRQTPSFRSPSKIQGQIYRPEYQFQNRPTQIYQIHPQVHEYRTYSVPPISQVSAGNYRSSNLFQDLNNNNNGYAKSNLQSKLLNRQLTDIKSNYGQNIASSRKIMNSEGVQSFPLKFDSNVKQQKDFTGCCGYKGKRVIYESTQKTPFC